MSLLWIVTIVGWLLVLIPLTLYVALTLQIVFGAAKDDDTIKGIVGLGILCLISGIVCLAMVYATNWIPT